jgi:hypothetical protein
MNAFGATLAVSCQIFVDFADEANSFSGVLASPRAGNQTSLTGRASIRVEIETVGNRANSIGEHETEG